MKRFVSQPLAAFAAVAFGIVTLAAAAIAPALAQAPAPTFGNPPSGEVPILYNDQHVYTKPDHLKQGRVLAALVRGKTILVPLRSMFEQMGATVSYNASTKTVDVSKPGADVQVTLGKPEVVLNGETRPLDVPPMMYKGSIVVPVRVISEAMGAYVLWVPDKRLVVVRYVPVQPPSPPPTMAPTAAPVPTAAPTMAPTPTPTANAGAEFFVAGDAMFDPKVYNEFSPGNQGGTDLAGRVGMTFHFDQLAFMAEGTYSQFRYPHRSSTGTNTGGPYYEANSPCGSGLVYPDGLSAAPAGDSGCVSVLGPASGSAYVPSFDARDTDIDGRVGIGIAHPNIYIVGSYDTRYGNYGYPRLSGVGGGLEKLPDFKDVVSIYGSVLYYPQLSGDYTDIFGNSQQLQYRELKYQAGLTINVPRTPLFLDAGYLGVKGTAKQNAPSGYSENTFYGGLGLHF